VIYVPNTELPPAALAVLPLQLLAYGPRLLG
jgi:hypothetical protein